MGPAQRLRAPTPLRKDARNRTNATYRSRQQAVNPTSSNNTGVFYLTIVRCTIHTPTVQCITLRCVQSTELPQHHKEYCYVLARQPQIDCSAVQIIQSDVLPQLSRYTRPLSRTPSLGVCIYQTKNMYQRNKKKTTQTSHPSSQVQSRGDLQKDFSEEPS